MKRIRKKLYKILRNIGIQRDIIYLCSINNERLLFDDFEEAYFLNLLEDSFDIQISNEDLDSLKTIDDTVDYLHVKLETFKKQI